MTPGQWFVAGDIGAWLAFLIGAGCALVPLAMVALVVYIVTTLTALRAYGSVRKDIRKDRT